MTQAQAKRVVWRYLHDQLALSEQAGLVCLPTDSVADQRRLRKAIADVRKELSRRGMEPVGRSR